MNPIDSILTSPGFAVLFFSNPMCGPCKGVKISLDVVKKSYPKVKYVDINTHANEELAKRYGVKSTPVLVFVNHGKEVGRIVGNTSSAMIVSIMKRHITT